MYRIGRQQHEVDMWEELEDYMASWDVEKRRTGTLSTKIWQTTQSNATEAENWENDFVEQSSKTKELSWSDEKSNPKCWLEKRPETVSHTKTCSRVKARGQGYV